jgi:DNA repair exonuclease SbcCD ATPase subunit
MRLKEFINEAVPVSAPSNVGRDYINMLNFVKGSGLEGVPADQQVAVALFKELQKQQQKNTQMGRELSAAEKRIDQATASGDMYGQELATHQAELDRERDEIDKQREKMGQIDQQYAGRAQASEQQMRSLTDQLEQLKTKPGVDQSTAETLQNQIEKLEKEGIGQDKYKELQKNIESIQSMQQVDDRVIQDLVTQIKSAESAAAKIDQTKQELSQQLDKTTQGALDQVEQMKQDLAKLTQLQTNIQSAVVDVLPQQIERLQSKIGELDSENEDQYNELLKHQQVLDKIAPGREGGTPQGQPGMPSPTTKPFGKSPGPGTPVGDNIAKQQQKIDARRLAQAQGINVIDFEKEPESMTESAFRRSIAWATGKTLKEKK